MGVDNQVTIVGGGPCGSLLAMVLKQRAYGVTVYEMRGEDDILPVPTEEVEGGMTKLQNASSRSINLALSHRGIESLAEVGVASDILQMALPMPSRYIHMTDGTTAIQPYGTSEEDCIYSVPRPGITASLLRLARERGVKYRFNMKFKRLDVDGRCVFEDKQTGEEVIVTSGVTFGCDGAFSAVRQSMNRHARLDLHTYYIKEGYKELTMPPRIDEKGEPQFAFPPNNLHIWPRDSFMLIALPNHDKSFTCTVFAPMDQLEEMQSTFSQKQAQEFLDHHFPDATPFMPDAAAEFLSSKASPLCQVKMSPWTYKNVALLGDASHAVVPFYGQGMNAAFEDTLIVGEMLDRASKKGLSRTDALLDVIAQITETRQPAADALNKLCIMNYKDMAHNTGKKTYLFRKRIEGFLHTFLPKYWIPLYTMVTFTRIPYNEVLDRHFRQEWLLSQFMKLFTVGAAVATLVGIRSCVPLRNFLKGVFSA